ncbi:MAG: DUF4224 domain-containing protein [Proteobacteria bacterium]|nr:MAG: DUF4224 domain-containing protein [Pseudomonadota bacterium]
MPDLIATRETLIELTGLRRPSAVRRWLDRECIPYMVGADGWPRVLQTIIMARLGGPSKAPVKEPQLRPWR